MLKKKGKKTLKADSKQEKNKKKTQDTAQAKQGKLDDPKANAGTKAKEGMELGDIPVIFSADELDIDLEAREYDDTNPFGDLTSIGDNYSDEDYN